MYLNGGILEILAQILRAKIILPVSYTHLHLVACQIYGSLDLALHAKHEYLRFQPARIVGIQAQQTDVFMRKVPDDPIVGKVYFPHYAKMGAAGAQLATRFIPTYECDASQTYKDVLLAAKPEDVRIIHSPVGMPGRALATPLVQKLGSTESGAILFMSVISMIFPTLRSKTTFL